MALKRGDICRTKLTEPGGLVMVLDIWDKVGDPTARIVHVDNHPYGYERGTTGDYYVKDLELVEASVVENCKGCGTQMDMCSYCHNSMIAAQDELYDEIEYDYYSDDPYDDYDYNPYDDDDDPYDEAPCYYCGTKYCTDPICAHKDNVELAHDQQWKDILWVKEGGDPLTWTSINEAFEIPF